MNLKIAGRDVALRIRRHARARRMILRIDPKDGAVVVTLPPYGAADDAVRMARDRADWIGARLDRRPAPIMFVEGGNVPVLGRDHVVRRDPRVLGARIEAGTIVIAGRPEHTARRVRDALIRRARDEIVRRVGEKTAQAGLKAGRIALKDTRSRWGSCAANGNLNFSWRLVMAPEFVLDYVIAHEVAHLGYHNHGPAFWRLVEVLCPGLDAARAWLRAHGATLHLYGPSSS
ncbi:M48 family metallopeptidase [Varunaivibrio sulfuroxidans]|uniref:M48 family metallopeptidase n=1 Tax=Varunaivibrio sulfuroxidans TaxID=1773489 RepID=UPI0014054D63|nr:SprT family zinc-dependent metalloprotease [Varunaivibrio sulfuroxidans]WES29552.1 SprT family zinc-dependent metalloprotease [Varunaivibrio sulfuroxidans]